MGPITAGVQFKALGEKLQHRLDIGCSYDKCQLSEVLILISDVTVHLKLCPYVGACQILSCSYSMLLLMISSENWKCL